MSSKFSNKYPIPEKFPEILHDFSREVLRYMPKDILDFAVQYFYSLETGNPLNYIHGASKSIPRVIDTTTIEKRKQMKDKRQDVSTPSLATNQNTQNLFFNKGEQSKKEKEEIKELKETKSSKMNSPAHSEAGSRPDSEMSRGSGVARASKVFVNNVFESSQQKVRESMNLYGKKIDERIDTENKYNQSGHTFSDVSGNPEDKNAVKNFVGDMFNDYKRNAGENENN